MHRIVSQQFADVAGYFDTPSMGLPCLGTVEAIREQLEGWFEGIADYPEWEETAEDCRALFAQRHGVHPGAVGLVPSITTVAASVARTLALRPGKVLIHQDEFRSLALPFAEFFGPERIVQVHGPYRADTFIAQLDDAIAGVIVSTVSSADGARVDLKQIYQATLQCGAALVVDATQSEGIVSTGIAWGAELTAVMTAGYKGLLGPRGTGYAIVDPALVELGPIAPSPYGMADNGIRGSYGVPGQAWPGGRGLSQSPAWLAWVGAQPGLRLLAQVPDDQLEEHALGLADQVRVRCAEVGIEAQSTDLASPIVSLPILADCAEELTDELTRRGLRAAIRLGRLRCGFHLYNNQLDVDALGEILSSPALQFFERT